MDTLSAVLELGAVTWFQAAIAVLTVAIIQGIRKILAKYVKGGWTQKIPGWVWMGLSVVLPIGLVFLAELNWVQSFLHLTAPDSIVAETGAGENGVLWSGIVTAFGANGSYQLAKKKGWLNDYKPGGPNDVTEKIKQDEAAAAAAEEERHQAVVAASMSGPAPVHDEEQSSVSASASSVAHPPAPATPSGFYVKARLSPYNEYAFLTEDGRLYRIKDGKITPLPYGWNE